MPGIPSPRRSVLMSMWSAMGVPSGRRRCVCGRLACSSTVHDKDDTRSSMRASGSPTSASPLDGCMPCGALSGQSCCLESLLFSPWMPTSSTRQYATADIRVLRRRGCRGPHASRLRRLTAFREHTLALVVWLCAVPLTPRLSESDDPPTARALLRRCTSHRCSMTESSPKTRPVRCRALTSS